MTSQWWEDEARFLSAVMQHGSPTQAARELGGISERTARRLAKVALSVPSSAPDQTALAGTVATEDGVVITTPAGVASMGPEDLLAERGLDPSKYGYKFSTRSWEAQGPDGQVVVLSQARVDATKIPELPTCDVLPAGWTPPPARRGKANTAGPRLKLFIPDPHFPLHEPHLIEATIAWLEDHADQVDEVMLLGDVSDASPYKRHTKNPRTDCTVEEHQQSTVIGLARWRQAAPDARIVWTPGNHDYWHIQRMRETMPHYEQIRRPVIDGNEVSWEEFDLLSIRSIFGLDQLRVEIIEAQGEYHDATYAIQDDLVALHGVATGVHAAIKEQAGWEGTSIIQAHAHKAQITAITKRLADGTETQRYAINAGTTARRDLGYSHKRDAGQCFVTITVHDDGRWHPELALFDPQTHETTWRDWRYIP